jgi:hypothetical protein
MKRTTAVLLALFASSSLVPLSSWAGQAPRGGAAAQAPASQARPAAGPGAEGGSSGPQRQQSPAMKALNDASAIKDADEKIAAFRKVIADFPNAPQADQANTLLLSALIAKGDAAAIAAQAKVIVDRADEASKSRLRRDVAASLLRGDVLLDDAEKYAKDAVEVLPDEKTYVEARKKDAAARAAARAAEGTGSGTPAAVPATNAVVATPSGPASPASDDALVSRYKSEKQTALLTLAQVYAKRTKAVEAEQAFRQAYAVDRKSASATTAAIELAKYAKAAGRDAEQSDYLVTVALAGRLTPESYADLQAVFKKSHGGSAAGLDDALDARYREDGYKAPEAEKYQRATDRSERLVLAEIFTGSGCPPCVAADLAFESAMHRYGKELAVLMYHLHVPRPDPMANPYTQSRAKFYAVPGVPTYVIDGDAKTGGGAADNALPFFKKSVEPVVDQRLTVKADAAITLKASGTDKAVKASVTVDPIETKATKLRLHLVLAEEQIRYSGENGIRFHPMVVRSMASTGAEPPKAPAEGVKPEVTPNMPIPILGFPIEPGKAKSVEYTFDLAKVAADGLANLVDLEQHSARYPNHKFVIKKHEVDSKKLSLIAFVQDEESKQVLQAVRVELK